ncbi:MAG: hypothetical protein ACK5N6_10135, partial [Microcystis sp.]
IHNSYTLHPTPHTLHPTPHPNEKLFQQTLSSRAKLISSTLTRNSVNFDQKLRKFCIFSGSLRYSL